MILGRDLAVAIAVDEIGATQAGEGIEPAAADQQRIDRDLFAIGQCHAGRGLLEAQAALRLHEAGDAEVELARGAQQLALFTFEVESEGAAVAGMDRQRCGGKVDDLAVGIGADPEAIDPVDAERELARRRGQAGHADHGRLGHARLERDPAARTGLAALEHQRQPELDAGHAQADRARVDRIAQIGPAIPVAVAAVGTIEADETIEVGAAHGQQVGADLAAVGQREGLAGLLDRDRATEVDKAAELDVDATAGAHQLAALAIMGQRQALAGTGHQRQGVVNDHAVHAAAAEVDHRRTALDQVEVDAERMHVETDIVRQAEHRIDMTDAGGQRGPARAGVGRVARREQPEAELDIAHAEAARLGIELVGLDHAVLVEVDAVGTDADETVKAGAAHAEHLGCDRVAVGQRDGLDAALEANRTGQFEEIAGTQIDVTAGAQQPTARAVHVEIDALAGASAHRHRTGIGREIDHAALDILSIGHAADQVDVDRQIARGQDEAGHADHRHAASTGLERGPLQGLHRRLARRGRGDHETEVQVAERQAERVRIRAVLRIDQTVAIAVLPVRAVDADEGVETLAAKGQRVDADLGAVSQHHLTDRFLEAQRAREVEEVTQRDGDIATGAHQRAQAAGMVEREAGAGGIDRHDQFVAQVVDDAAVATQVDVDRQLGGIDLDQRQADLGRGLGRGGQAGPETRPCVGGQRLGRIFQVDRERQVQAAELEAGRLRIERLVRQIAVVVAVEAVGAVEADEGVHALATEQPAPHIGAALDRSARAAVGELDRVERGRQLDATVSRQEIGGRKRHADVVAALDAEIVLVEEHANLTSISTRMGLDAQLAGGHALADGDRQPIDQGLQAQHGAALVIAEQAERRIETTARPGRVDQLVMVAQDGDIATGLDPDIEPAGQAQVTRDLQLVGAALDQRERQRLAGRDGLVALDADHTRRAGAAVDACGRVAQRIDDAQARRRAHQDIPRSAHLLAHLDRAAVAGRVDQIDRGLRDEFDRTGIAADVTEELDPAALPQDLELDRARTAGHHAGTGIDCQQGRRRVAKDQRDAAAVAAQQALMTQHLTHGQRRGLLHQVHAATALGRQPGDSELERIDDGARLVDATGRDRSADGLARAHPERTCLDHARAGGIDDGAGPRADRHLRATGLDRAHRHGTTGREHDVAGRKTGPAIDHGAGGLHQVASTDAELDAPAARGDAGLLLQAGQAQQADGATLREHLASDDQITAGLDPQAAVAAQAERGIQHAGVEISQRERPLVEQQQIATGDTGLQARGTQHQRVVGLAHGGSGQADPALGVQVNRARHQIGVALAGDTDDGTTNAAQSGRAGHVKAVEQQVASGFAQEHRAAHATRQAGGAGQIDLQRIGQRADIAVDGLKHQGTGRDHGPEAGLDAVTALQHQLAGAEGGGYRQASASSLQRHATAMGSDSARERQRPGAAQADRARLARDTSRQAADRQAGAGQAQQFDRTAGAHRQRLRRCRRGQGTPHRAARDQFETGQREIERVKPDIAAGRDPQHRAGHDPLPGEPGGIDAHVAGDRALIEPDRAAIQAHQRLAADAALRRAQAQGHRHQVAVGQAQVRGLAQVGAERGGAAAQAQHGAVGPSDGDATGLGRLQATGIDAQHDRHDIGLRTAKRQLQRRGAQVELTTGAQSQRPRQLPDRRMAGRFAQLEGDGVTRPGRRGQQRQRDRDGADRARRIGQAHAQQGRVTAIADQPVRAGEQ